VKIAALAVVTLTVIVAMTTPASTQRASRSRAPVAGYRVVHVFPHDSEAFTQGLVYLDGLFYEGTGLNGRSTIRKVKIETGQVMQLHKLDSQYFGEGIAILNDTLFQLTWQSGIAFLYDRTTFTRTGTFSYTGEGWGLTHDGRRLIMSDGTATLRFIDPASHKEISRLAVRDGGKPVLNLNELEYIKGEVFANVWQTDRIARISPKTGEVTGWIDLKGLLPVSEQAPDAVLNGIAYDAAGDRLFVTGKLWPKVFEIRIVP
jgi:glutaminyl-peptide cyclotransferase